MKQIRKKKKEWYDYCEYWKSELHEVFKISFQENYLENHKCNFCMFSTISRFSRTIITVNILEEGSRSGCMA